MSGCHIENISRFGFFGKLPINGDFIQRDLPAHFVHRWDGWLQENLAACQQQLEESWLKHYLTSPVWRFFIAPSVIDDNAYIGIFGPSVDRVGRYFPMTIATPVSAEHIPSLFSTAFQEVFSELEVLFLKYLNADSSTGNISVETLSLELQQHSEVLHQLIKTQNLDQLPESLDSHRFVLSDQSDIAGAVSGLWLMQIMKQHTGATLWWSNGSHAFEPSLLINRGFPDKQQFIAMLSGFDNNNHWRQKQLSIALPEKASTEAPSNTGLAPEITVHGNQADITPDFNTSHATASQPLPHSGTDSPEKQPPDYSELAEIDQVQIQPIKTNSPIENLLLLDDETGSEPLISDSDSSSKQLLDDFLRDSADSTDDYSISTEAGVILSDKTNTTPLLEQTSAGFSEIGHKRVENQDAILIHRSQSMWVVADGMGGHSEGDKASQAIVDQLSELNLEGDLFSNIEQVKAVLDQVNRLILDFAKANQTTCGSTVVVLLRNHNQCAYLWAGDSRLYLSRNGELNQLTKDHSVENGLSQKNNAITRAVGVYEHLDIECGFHQLLAGDRFLLCSDGVYDSISNDQINDALSISSPLEASAYLKQHVLAGSAKDNLSGTLIWF